MLITLLVSLSASFFNSESKELVTNEGPENMLVDHRAVQLYKWQQEELNAAIQAYFEKAVASGVIVGAGVSIVKGDSIVLSKGYGKRNINRNDIVDGQTVFRLGRRRSTRGCSP